MDNKNKCAFPTLTYSEKTGLPNGQSLGLSKREYFTGITLQGLLAGLRNQPFDSIELTKAAVRIADEILTHLESK